MKPARKTKAMSLVITLAFIVIITILVVGFTETVRLPLPLAGPDLPPGDGAPEVIERFAALSLEIESFFRPPGMKHETHEEEGVSYLDPVFQPRHRPTPRFTVTAEALGLDVPVKRTRAG